MWNSKPKKSNHRCSKRKHGNPKIGTGICHGFDIREAVKERIEGKKLERNWWHEESRREVMGIIVLGPTGKFPLGKLRDDDEGGLTSAITHTDKAVIIEFGKPVLWVGLAAADARQLAATLLIHAEALEKEQEKSL